jgi:hypothetical protein
MAPPRQCASVETTTYVSSCGTNLPSSVPTLNPAPTMVDLAIDAREEERDVFTDPNAVCLSPLCPDSVPTMSRLQLTMPPPNQPTACLLPTHRDCDYHL